MADTKTTPTAPVIDITMKYVKGTKGTHVYGNDEYNMTVYVPRPLLAGKCDPANVTMRLQLTPQPR